MNGNIRVGNLFGIPFYVNPSWFLVLGLMTLTYGGQLATFPQLHGIIPWLLGLVAALLLFASVLAHELGHSFVAINQGISVKSITLFLFGGLANLEKESETPLETFLIAIAGPAVSLFLFGLLTVISTNLALPTPFRAILSLLASINLILALFNLIPGLPLDGGNVLKAAIWKITGNRNQGILIASRVGQGLGGFAILVGFLSVAGIIPFGNFWTILIGWFLLQNAGGSARSASLNKTLQNLTAEDAIIPESPIVSSELSLREFANNYVIGQTRWTQFLVTNKTGQLLGIVATEQLKSISTADWPKIQVKALVKPVEEMAVVQGQQSLLEVTKLLEKNPLKQLTVIGDDNQVLGLLEVNSILNLIRPKTVSKAT